MKYINFHWGKEKLRTRRRKHNRYLDLIDSLTSLKRNYSIFYTVGSTHYTVQQFIHISYYYIHIQYIWSIRQSLVREIKDNEFIVSVSMNSPTGRKYVQFIFIFNPSRLGDI